MPQTPTKLQQLEQVVIQHQEQLFRSGQHPGVFIPCTIALSDNSIEKITLALRNDNDAQAWCIDGGI